MIFSTYSLHERIAALPKIAPGTVDSLSLMNATIHLYKAFQYSNGPQGIEHLVQADSWIGAIERGQNPLRLMMADLDKVSFVA